MERPYQLAHRADGACVGLAAVGRCRIHTVMGLEAKPLACRLYPFVVVPAERGVAISLRSGCPSVASNKGRPMPKHRALAETLAAEVTGDDAFDPPFASRTEMLDWGELRQIAEAADGLLADQTHPPSDGWSRWRGCAN